RLRPDTCRDFLLYHTDESHANGVPQSVFHHLFKRFLTAHSRFDMLLCVSHWYPPGNLDCELVASSGYQTLLLHTIQDTTTISDKLNKIEEEKKKFLYILDADLKKLERKQLTKEDFKDAIKRSVEYLAYELTFIVKPEDTKSEDKGIDNR
ncbi:MAG TPA: hypothetical protein VEP90_07160, partial [Methylomirabilota bacterium]|nr:hypothetical protein [Methylomirabilota bacterium]